MKIREIKLLYSPASGESPKITTSQEAYKILIGSWAKSTIGLYEEFKAVLIDQSGKVLGILPIARGGVTACLVDRRLLMAACLIARATRLIVAHNHPSGLLKPSPPDIVLTSKIKQACEFFDIELVDHLILTPDGFMSFQDEGML